MDDRVVLLARQRVSSWVHSTRMSQGGWLSARIGAGELTRISVRVEERR